MFFFSLFFIIVHAKQLSWVSKVVTAEEYHSAKTQALECQREKKRFEQQRHAFHRSAVRQAATLSGGVTYGSSVIPEQAQEESMQIKDLEAEVQRQAEDLRAMAEELENSDQLIVQLEAEKASAIESKDLMAQSWKFTMSQLESTQQELQAMKRESRDANNESIAELSEENHGMKEEIDVLNSTVEICYRSILTAEQRVREIKKLCHEAVSRSDEERFATNKNHRDRLKELEGITSTYSVPTDIVTESRALSSELAGALLSKKIEANSDGSTSSTILMPGQRSEEEVTRLYRLIFSLYQELEDFKGLLEDKSGRFKSICDKLNLSLNEIAEFKTQVTM